MYLYFYVKKKTFFFYFLNSQIGKYIILKSVEEIICPEVMLLQIDSNSITISQVIYLDK
jgi:hypothetical protein